MHRRGETWFITRMKNLFKLHDKTYKKILPITSNVLILIFGLTIFINTSVADDYKIGDALYKIGIAEHLRDSIISTECKQYISPALLGTLWGRNYRQLSNEISLQLSPQDQAEYKALVSSEKYKNQQRQSQRIYITEALETLKKSGVPVSFACGFSYSKVFEAMGRAESAISAIKNR